MADVKMLMMMRRFFSVVIDMAMVSAMAISALTEQEQEGAQIEQTTHYENIVVLRNGQMDVGEDGGSVILGIGGDASQENTTILLGISGHIVIARMH